MPVTTQKIFSAKVYQMTNSVELHNARDEHVAQTLTLTISAGASYLALCARLPQLRAQDHEDATITVGLALSE